MWSGHLPQCKGSDQVKIAFIALHSTYKVEIPLKSSKLRVCMSRYKVFASTSQIYFGFFMVLYIGPCVDPGMPSNGRQVRF